MIDFIKVANNVVVVNDLPHSNPFIKEMVIQMCQLINHIECRRWYSNIPCPIGQPHNMRTLQIRIPSKPFLQSSMIKRIIHCAREEMQLYWYSIYRSFYMLIPYIITNLKMLLAYSVICSRLAFTQTSISPGFREYAFGYIKAFPCPFRMQHLRPSSLSIE